MTYLWFGVMAQRSCRGSWTTWAVSVRMSSSPWRQRGSHLTFQSTDICGRLNSSLGHAVYCKPTNSNLCLNPRSHHPSPLFQTTGCPHHRSAHCHRFVWVMEPAWWVGMLQIHFKGKMLKKTLWHICGFGNTSFLYSRLLQLMTFYQLAISQMQQNQMVGETAELQIITSKHLQQIFIWGQQQQ